MKNRWKGLAAAFLSAAIFCSAGAQQTYVPTADNLQARHEFAQKRLGIFLHWGIYSLFAQGEWYLNSGKLNKDEYAKAASAFYPARFNADEWVRAFKQAGAGYITFTTRHHDGFSMFRTAESNYNIVEATPFGRDVLKELAEACHREGIRLHLYYSILDWIREDYPLGRTGLNTGRKSRPDYDHYLQFMKNQMKELLTNYGDVKAVWLDGYWDHDQDKVPFDWRMEEFYRYIHQLKPSCLIGNNHHITPLAGEDFQMFERDQPGENKAGLSGQDISTLPLEMCQTMNGMWGYKVADLNYKSTKELIQMLVKAASKSCNLLINIGPQPNGELPELALDRLRGIGAWMQQYGPTVDGTMGGPVGQQPWGVSTARGKTLFLHVMSPEGNSILVAMEQKPKKIIGYKSRKALQWHFDRKKHTALIQLEGQPDNTDYVIEVTQ
ncbi:MAG: alpha-L-fucosidase [Prevotella sp.]|nr:alpha-L-fucosidase [Prevotella sp.]MDY4040187.1 alpha-L-fucosidase [Prevotella sp.]